MVNLSFMARGGRLAQGQDEPRPRSDFVEVVIAGWHPGDGNLDNHTLRILIRDGGLRLGEAVRLANAVVDGHDVKVRMPFADHGAAILALEQIGARATVPAVATVPAD
jgi:hypothetical protein